MHSQNSLRRYNSRSRLPSLTAAQKDEVASWLLDERLSQNEAAKRVQEVFGFPVGQSSISRFWYRECVPRKLLRSAEAARSVQAVADSLKEDWQGVNAQLLGQRIFETLAAPEVDLKVVSALGAVLEKVKTRALHEKALSARVSTEQRRDDQKERQMAFAREKFEFDAVEAALAHAPAIRAISDDGALSSGEKREQLRRLLFPQAFGDSPA